MVISNTITDETIRIQQRNGLMERLMDACEGTMDLFTFYLGTKLGLYEALNREGALTSSQLADIPEPTSATFGNGSNNRPWPAFSGSRTKPRMRPGGNTGYRRETWRFSWLGTASTTWPRQRR